MTDLFTQIPGQLESKNSVAELVGDGKKFKTVEDLAKGKVESDNYIKELESRLDEQREQYLKLFGESTTRAKLEDLVNQIREPRPSDQGTNPAGIQDNIKPSYDPSQIESVVSRKIQEIEFKKTQSENLSQVQVKLQEKFGDNYTQILNQQSQALGLSKEYVNDLAATQPKAFYRLFGMEDQPTRNVFQTPPRSEQRSEFKPTVQKRSWSFYQDLKKTNPKLYSDPKTQYQLHKDAESLGSDFMDGDFYAY